MYELLKSFLMTAPSLGNRKFMIDVRDNNVTVSQLPDILPGTATVLQYPFAVNARGDNISSEAERIKVQIVTDCFSPPTAEEK